MNALKKSLPISKQMSKVPRAGKDYDLRLPKGYLSWSQISLHRSCGEKYRREYKEGVPRPYNSAFFEGTVMDHVLEQSNLRYIEKRKHLTKTQAHGCYAEKFEEDKPNVEVWLDDSADILDRGATFIDKFWDNKLHVQMKPIAAQREFFIEIVGVPVKGVIDLLEMNLVCDFKVAKDAKYYDPTVCDQMWLYALATGVEHVAYQIFEKKSMSIRWKEATVNLERAQWELERLVSSVAFQISHDLYPPNSKDFFCSGKWCSHYFDCVGKDEWK